MGGEDLLTPSQRARKEANFWKPLRFDGRSRSEFQAILQLDDCCTWRDKCYACGLDTEGGRDLFCGNYNCTRGTYPICLRSWHPRCYEDLSKRFHINDLENDKGLIWGQSKKRNRFLQARKGDMLSFLFQCEHCWFVNLMKRPASEFTPHDLEVMTYIRRVNLDMFWAKEPQTVSNSFKAYQQARRNSFLKGMPPDFIVQGPYPLSDPYGMGIAIDILVQSERQGKSPGSHVGYTSLAKIRSGYATLYNATPYVNQITVIRTNKGTRLRNSHSPTDSQLFDWFMLGLRKRIGVLVNQNLGISVEVMLEILNRYDAEIEDEDLDFDRLRTIIVCGAAFIILFAASLRGNEVLMLERSEFVKSRNAGKTGSKDTEHVVIPLMGRFKGEAGDRNSLLVVARKSKSGLDISRWIDQLSALLEIENKSDGVGPAICFENGSPMSSRFLDSELRTVLSAIQEESPNLIDPAIDVNQKFSVYRSFRRGATTRAREAGVSDSDINLANRWRSVQNNGGGIPNLPMHELYTEISQTLQSRLRFSQSL